MPRCASKRSVDAPPGIFSVSSTRLDLSVDIAAPVIVTGIDQSPILHWKFEAR